MHQLMDLWVVPTSFLAVVKNNALNISEPICVDVFISLEMKVELLGNMVILCLII